MADFKSAGEIIDTAEKQQERTMLCEVHGAFTSRLYRLFDGGREHWTRCQACADTWKARHEERAAALQAENEAAQHEERLARAGIPMRFRSRSLASFVADTEPKRHALTVVTQFAESFHARYNEGANLIFSGSPGTGKSHLALGIAQAILPRWNSIYVTARELVMRLRSTWRDDSPVSEIELQRTFTRTHLLIIDEVGVQFGTEAERTQLFGIIDERYREQKPSILLSNLDIEAFKGFIGQRAYDRLRECGQWIAFDWESYRGR